MPVIVVTRLRLRDPALLTEFFTRAPRCCGKRRKQTATSVRMSWATLTTGHDKRPHLR